MSDKLKFTVIGAGHGGKAMAAHLALMGFPTILYNRTPDRIAAIRELGGIDLEGFDSTSRGFWPSAKSHVQYGGSPRGRQYDHGGGSILSPC
jgi:flavin-dependent dehydrogenase